MPSQVSVALDARASCAAAWLSWIAWNENMDIQLWTGRGRGLQHTVLTAFIHPCPWDSFLTNAKGCGRALGRDMVLV